jgi:hypothetical protein
MPIFLSHNNTIPYNTLTDLRVNDTMEVSLTSGSNIIEYTAILYIIATGELFSNLEIKVENENSSGTSLYISPVDGIGNPTHWGKLITLTNIDARDIDVKIMIKYKWQAINNIYILKRLNVSGNINIYGV